jgi:hypothetical protein
MNAEALFLFLILLLGLLLCSFLGSSCNKEGFDLSLSSVENSMSNVYDDTANAVDSAYDDTANAVDNTYNSTANAVDNAYDSASNAVSNTFDNYNHYTGSSTQLQSGTIFTDPSGNTITVVTNSNGTQSLQLLQVGVTTPMILLSTPPSSSNISAAPNTFYAQIGNFNATVITGSNGQTAIQFNLPTGQTIIFSQSSSSTNANTNTNTTTSTQYYGSTGYPIQQAPNSLAYQGPYGGSAGAATGPYGNTAYYAQGPNGNAVAGTQPYGYPTNQGAANNYNNAYNSSLPPGIPASQIPPGQQDLYILKSEVVPPVCPACPVSSAYPRKEKCPACPACARCSEPSFECKKVPNYNAINNDYLPSPVLNDFSQFGM